MQELMPNETINKDDIAAAIAAAIAIKAGYE